MGGFSIGEQQDNRLLRKSEEYITAKFSRLKYKDYTNKEELKNDYGTSRQTPVK